MADADRPGFERYSKNQDPAWFSACIVFTATTTAAIFWLCYFQPAHYLLLIVIEDGWADYGVAVSYVGASILFISVALRPAVVSDRTIFLLLGLGCIFMAGEEVSWGQRIFSYSTPDAWNQINYQGEITVHNTEYFDDDLLKFILSIALVFWSLCSAVFALSYSMRHRVTGFFQPFFFPLGLIPLFLIFPLFRLLVPLPRSDEVGELFLALSAILWSLHFFLGYGRTPRIAGVRAVVAMLALLTAITISSGFLTHRAGFSTGLAQWLLNFTMSTSFHNTGMHAQAEATYEYIRSHPEYLTEETDLKFALIQVDNGAYDRARDIAMRSIRQLELPNTGPENNADTNRIVGILYFVTGQPAAATEYFRNANRIDRAKLAAVSDFEEQANVLFSLARTAKISGSTDATELAAAAVSASSSARSDKKFKDWIECANAVELPNPCYGWPEILAIKFLR